MSSRWGAQAVVIGAGIGGLAAAAALAQHFQRVSVLERDELPSRAVAREGAPQGRHIHVLLAGGLRALSTLLPELERDLLAAGAVTYRAGLDLRSERPGFDPFPQRDLGWLNYALSRPLLEFILRRRVAALGVSFRDRSRVERIVLSGDGRQVASVEFAGASGEREAIEADLVVDASARGGLTLSALERTGGTLPEEVSIGIDVGYSTALFARPANTPRDWTLLQVIPQVPEDSRGGLLVPVEGDRWMVSLGGRGDQRPPGDGEGFLRFARSLRTPTLAAALEQAPQLGEVVRFGFRASTWRRFDRVAMPLGLFPIGDAACCFNPIYGQGMSVAAQQAALLGHLLHGEAPGHDGSVAVGRRYFAEAAALIEQPWDLAAVPDLAYPDAHGQRPPDLARRLAVGAALTRLAAADAEVNRLFLRVYNLLDSRDVLNTPALRERLLPFLETRG